MAQELPRSGIFSLFSPATDIPAILAVALGGAMVFALDELPLKLIGGCVALLGGLGLFLLYSQRMRDASLTAQTPVGPRPSATVPLAQKVEQDSTSKRLIFDDFATSFGSEDTPPARAEAPTPYRAEATVQGEQQEYTDDDGSGIRIIGTVKSATRVSQNESIPKASYSEPEHHTADDSLDVPTLQHRIQATDEGTSSYSPRRYNLKVQMSDLVDEIPDDQPSEPRKEFDIFVRRILQVIRSMVDARTTAFLWVNFDDSEFLVETYISDVEKSFTTRKKIPFGNDIISQIAGSGAPEILTDINPSACRDLLPYYDIEIATKSFIGVPVYHGGGVVGIVLADSDVADVYDSTTVAFLGHFTKLISRQVQNYTTVYDLLQSAKIMTAVDTLATLLRSSLATREDVCKALLQSVGELIKAKESAVVTFDDEQGLWYVAANSGKGSLGTPGTVVNINDSLVGEVILSGSVSGYVHEGRSSAVCFHRQEMLTKGDHYTFVPLKSLPRSHGALCIHTDGKHEPTAQDVKALELLADLCGTVLEQLYSEKALRLSSLVDGATGVWNQGAFTMRLVEEVARAADSGLALCLVLIRRDKLQMERNFSSDAEFHRKATKHIIDSLRPTLRSYDIIATMEEGTFAVCFWSRSAQEVRMWGEHVRKDIASSFFDHNSSKIGVTVSVGIAQLQKNDSADTLLAHAKAALQAASAKVNTVTVYA